MTLTMNLYSNTLFSGYLAFLLSSQYIFHRFRSSCLHLFKYDIANLDDDSGKVHVSS